MMHRETGRPEYLEQARRVAHLISSHPRLPTDLDGTRHALDQPRCLERH